MKLICLLVLAAMLSLGCTITVRPIPTKQKKSSVRSKPHKKSHEKSKRITSGVVKETWWIENYHKLEAAHGDYTIPGDADIRPLPNGSFLVPDAVLRHYQDLLTAPKAVPTP